MYEYGFISAQQGQFAERCNEFAQDGFSVQWFVKDGDKFYLLFSKYIEEEGEGAADSITDELWVRLDEQAGRIAALEAVRDNVATSSSVKESPAEE